MNAPVYIKLRDDLKSLIEARKMLPGEPLPSENDLSKKYTISRSSVRLAMQELEAAGLIIKQQGKGSIVNDFNIDTAAPPQKKIIGIDLNNSYLLAPEGAWYYGDILRGIQEATAETKSRLQLVSENDFTDPGSIDVDGLIITRYESWAPEKLSLFTNKNIPVVVMNRFLNDAGLSYVAVDDTMETYKAVEYLIQLGHRKIAFAGGNTVSVKRRRTGYLSALKTYDIPIQNELIFSEELSTSLHEKLKNFLKTTTLTALIAGNGAYCTAVLPIIAKMELKVPDDLSLICFDDIEINGVQHETAISCIRMPLVKMGRTALNHVINPTGNRMRQVFPAELVIRKSCASLNYKTEISLLFGKNSSDPMKNV